MREKRSTDNSKIIIVLLLITAIAIAISIWALFFRQPQELKEADELPPVEQKIEKNFDSISIPGYEGITLEADSVQQSLCLSNPPQNTCYFVIALYLEDGTMLWKSDYIKPGEESEPIVLNQKLQEGTYHGAYLQYSCYAMDNEQTQLNGAKTKVTLRVK